MKKNICMYITGILTVLILLLTISKIIFPSNYQLKYGTYTSVDSPFVSLTIEKSTNEVQLLFTKDKITQMIGTLTFLEDHTYSVQNDIYDNFIIIVHKDQIIVFMNNMKTTFKFDSNAIMLPYWE